MRHLKDDPKVKKYWVSCKMFTGQVNVDDFELICFVPRVWSKFRGEKFHKLTWWLKRFGKVDVIEMDNNEFTTT